MLLFNIIFVYYYSHPLANIAEISYLCTILQQRTAHGTRAGKGRRGTQFGTAREEVWTAAILHPKLPASASETSHLGVRSQPASRHGRATANTVNNIHKQKIRKETNKWHRKYRST